MQRIIVVTSGKGGVGKTTTAVNLGAALNAFGKDVVIVDGNLSTPNVGIHLGAPEVPTTLNHVISKKAKIYSAVYEHESGMKVLPASISIKEFEKTKPEKLKDIRKELSKVADYVIVDTAAGIGVEAMSAVDLGDEIIIVTNPEMPAIADALKMSKMAEKRGKKMLGVIVTRVKKNKSELEPNVVKGMLDLKVLGMIPEEKAVQESLRRKDALVHTHPNSKGARAYKEIAANIIGVSYDSKKDTNMFERFFGFFR